MKIEELTQDNLTQLTELAEALMTPQECAILLEIIPDEHAHFEAIMTTHKQNPIYIAYLKGKLKTKFELRKSIINLAKKGSPAAEPLALKFIKESL